ncbi:DUF3102 domain-containing protein [Roseomonas mucosa]|uniref:DUF3102 domain-containing protein n=1 Tax=Roseomonas mucosa TaxID=207340 RepID=UPI0028CE4A51|nr:DUF3102 domain-containing protein [Roseomonas sp. DSM 102946]
MASLPLSLLDQRQVCTFDYSTLTPDLADKVQQTARIINRAAARNVLIIGQHLRAAKEAMPHGSFIPWVEAELGMSARTAQNYMAASRWLEDKPAPVSHLPAKVIYALSSPATPAAVVQETVEAAAAGTLPTPEAISHRIEVARAEAREVKRLVAAKPGRTEQDAQQSITKARAKRAAEREAAKADWDRRIKEREQHQASYREAMALIHREHGDALTPVLQQFLAMAEEDLMTFVAALRATVNSVSETEGGR